MRYFEEINSTLSWYQNHVGTYDKAKWEQTVEERILNGINHIPTKSTKLATELIDLDLVQGSSFPKAKAKYGLYTVAKHGLVHLAFLPFYSRWWTTISSPKLYLVFLALYIVQFINVGLYLTQQQAPAVAATVNGTNNATATEPPNANGAGTGGVSSEVTIQTTEIVAPIVLMIVLTILHSQIIATHASLYSKPAGAEAARERERKKTTTTSSCSSLSSKFSSRSRIVQLQQRRSSLTSAAPAPSVLVAPGSGNTTAPCTTATSRAAKRTSSSRLRFPRRRSSALAATGASNSPQRPLQPAKRLSINETQLDNALSGCALRRRRRGPITNGHEGDDDEEQGHQGENGAASASPSPPLGALTPAAGACAFVSSLKNSPNSKTGSEPGSGKSSDTSTEYFHHFPLVHDPIIKRHLVETLSTFDRDEAKTLLNPLNRSLTPNPDPENACLSVANACSHAGSAAISNAISKSNVVLVNGAGAGVDSGASSLCNGNGIGAVDGGGHGSHSLLAPSATCDQVASTFSSITPPNQQNGVTLKIGPRKQRRPRILSEETSAASADMEEPSSGNQGTGTRPSPQKSNEVAVEDTSEEERHQRLKKKQKTQATQDGKAEEDYDDEEDEDEAGGPHDEDEDDDDLRSKSEWTAVTTNSEDEDYVAEEDVNNDSDNNPDTFFENHPFAWEFASASASKAMSSPSCTSSDRVSCTIWEGQDTKKADLTVLDISATIIARVERARENADYLYLGIFLSVILAALPCLWRLDTDTIDLSFGFDFDVGLDRFYDSLVNMLGVGARTRAMILISALERLCLSFLVFFLLAVAEKTYKQRFLYSKLFSRITSTRKARKSGIPHFRLNKVRNIKTWLSVRSYLQKRGPQRSVNIIVSSTFISVIILIFFLSVELLKDSTRMYYLYNIEVLVWSLCLGVYLLRFMTLGARISQKYRNLSVIITEQLNLYLKMEQKPHKKDELMVANNVLKLAAELLKELDDPFKISSFATNPYLYNITRIVILSAFSGVLSEMLGFKLKLYKIKLK